MPMPDNIENNIVKVQLDTKDFAKNAAKAIEAVDKLKESVNTEDSGKGIKKLAKSLASLPIKPIESSLDVVHDKFAALRQVADGFFFQVGSNLEMVAEKMVRGLTIDNVTAGWQKYADKTTAVQTIMAATGDQFENTGEQMEFVNHQIERLNWFTDETSYNLTDMVSNIGKFTSSGVELETSVKAMEGIATWAAVSGQNSRAASRAMYNLSQALGLGAVRVQDWMSVENANMATKEFKETAIETAVELGTLQKSADGVITTLEKGTEVTAASFRTTLAENWLTTDVLTSTLNKYGQFTSDLNDLSETTGLYATELLGYLDDYRNGVLDVADLAEELQVDEAELKKSFDTLADSSNALGEKAFRAAQEAKTFQEAIDSVKDALSTGWMNIFESIFGDYLQAKELWTNVAEALYDTFVEPLNSLYEIVDEAFGYKGPLSDLEKVFSDLGLTYEQVVDEMTNGSSEQQKAIAKLVEEYGSFEEAAASGKISLEDWGDALDRIASKTSGDAGALARNAADYKDVVLSIIQGDWRNGVDRMEKLTEAGYDYMWLQAMVNDSWDEQNKTYDINRVNWEHYSEVIEKTNALTSDQEIAIRDLSEQLKNGEIDSNLKTILMSLNHLGGREQFIQGIYNLGGAIGALIDTVSVAWSNVFPKATYKDLLNLISSFYTSTGNIKAGIESISEDISKALNLPIQLFRGVLVILKTIGKIITRDIIGNIPFKWILARMNELGYAVENIVDLLSNNLFPAILILTEAGFDTLSKFAVGLGDMILEILKFIDIKSLFDGLVDGVHGLLTGIATFAPKALNAIRTFFATLFPGLKKLTTSKTELTAFDKAINIVFDNITTILSEENAEYVKKIFGDIIDAVTGGVETVTETVDSVTPTIDKVSDVVNESVSSLNAGSKAINGFSGAITNALNKVSSVNSTVDETIPLMTSDIDGVYVMADGLNNVAQSAETVDEVDWGELRTTIVSAFSKIADAGAEALSESEIKLNQTTVVMTAYSYAILKFAKSLRQTGEKFRKSVSGIFDSVNERVKDMISAFARVPTSFSTFLTALGDSVKTLSKSISRAMTGVAILSFALSIKILTTSLLVLADTPWESILKGVEAMGLLGAVLVGFAAAISYVAGTAGSPKNMLMLSVSMIAIAGALLALAAGYAAITNVVRAFNGAASSSSSGFGKSIVAFAVIFGAVGILITNLKNAADASRIQSATQAIQSFASFMSKAFIAATFIIGFVMFLNAFRKLAVALQDVPVDTIILSLGSIFVLFKAIEKFTKSMNISDTIGYGTTILGMSASVIIMAKALEMLSKISAQSMISGLLKFGGVFVALLALTKLVPKNSLQKIYGFGTIMMSLAVSLIGIVVAVKMMANMEPDAILKGVAGAVALLLGMSAFIWALSKTLPKFTLDVNARAITRTGATMILISGAMLILAAAVMALGFLPIDHLAKGVGAVFILLAGMALVISQINSNANFYTSGVILTAISGIMAILIAIGMLATVEDSQKLLSVMATVSGVFIGFSLIIKQLTSIGGEKNKLNTGALIGSIVGVAAVMAAIYGLAMYTDGVSPDKFVAIGKGFSLSLLAFGGVLIAAGYANKIGKDVNIKTTGALLVAGIGGVIGVAIALGVLTAFVEDADKMIKVSEGFSMALIAFSVSLVIISAAALVATPALARFPVLGTAIGALVLVVAAIGILGAFIDEMFGDGTTMKALDKMVVIRIKLGEVIGSFVGAVFGSMVGTAFEELFDSIVIISGMFQTLHDNLLVFKEGDGTLTSIDIFGSIVTKLADISSQASSVDAEKVQEFADALGPLGEGLRNFVRIAAGKANINESGDIVSLTDVVETTLTVTDNDLKNIMNASTAMRHIIDALIGLRNMSGLIAGDTLTNGDIESFTTNLPLLGSGITNYANSVAAITDIAKAESAIPLLKQLINAANDLSPSKGLFGDKVGDLSKFSSNIEEVGKGLAAFRTETESVADPEKLKGVSESLGYYIAAGAAIGKNIYALNTVGSWSDSYRTKFSDSMVAMAKVIVAFSDELGSETLNETTLKAAFTAVDGMVNLANTFQGDYSARSEHLKNFSSNMIGFATNINTFYRNLDAYGLTNETFTYIQNAINSFTGLFTGISTSGSTESLNAMTGVVNRYMNFISLFLSNINNEKTQVQIGDAGKKFIEFVATGMQTQIKNEQSKTSITKTAQQLVQEFYGRMTDGENKILMESAGKYFVEGVAKGIDDNTGTVYTSVQTMADGMVATLQAALDIHSPSRVTEALGGFFSEGFAKGIIDKVTSVKSAITNLADNAKTGMQNAIQSALDMVTSDMQNGLTITPVLDLSEIQNGANMIPDLLGSNGYNFAITDENLAAISNGWMLNNADITRDLSGLQGAGNIVFNQNNYSPTSLSRYEIYRQTKNLLTMVKG